jgi:hypothetical protein
VVHDQAHRFVTGEDEARGDAEGVRCHHANRG